MEQDYSLAPQAEAEDAAQPGLLLSVVHNLYRLQFRRWFGIMAPTSLLAGVVLVLADHQIRAISRSVSRGEIWYIATSLILRFGGYFLSWLLGCFALAAVATVVIVQ